MGSGDWLKNIINLNKARKQKSYKTKDSLVGDTNGFILKPRFTEESTNIINRFNGHHEAVGLLAENRAAIRIQTAFRAFKARKIFSNLKRIVRLQMLMEGDFGKKQTSNTLRNLQSWSRIQARIRSQRLATVGESGIKQKLEIQLRRDAKALDLEVEWKDSPHTMNEALARLKQREEATIKRERAMAYAFSHQWRAHSNSNLGINDSDLATSNWGWSVLERWIAARPLESQALAVSTPKKVNSPTNKKSLSTKKSKSLKTSPNGKKTSLNRRLSYGSAVKAENGKTKPEKHTTK